MTGRDPAVLFGRAGRHARNKAGHDEVLNYTPVIGRGFDPSKNRV